MIDVQRDLDILRHFFQEIGENDLQMRHLIGSATTESISDGNQTEISNTTDIFHPGGSGDGSSLDSRSTLSAGVPSIPSSLTGEEADAEYSSRKVSELTKKVAELTAKCARLECALTESQLEQRTLASGNTILQEEMTQLKRRADCLEAEKQATSHTLQKEKRALEERATKYNAVWRDFELLKKDYYALHEHQWDTLLSASSQMDKLCRKLSQENSLLKEKLQKMDELEERSKVLEEEKVYWQREAAAQAAQREQWEQDWDDVQLVSHQCKELAKQLQDYWSSTQREGMALREALETAHFILQQWEDHATEVHENTKAIGTALPPLKEIPFPSYSIGCSAATVEPFEPTTAGPTRVVAPKEAKEEKRILPDVVDRTMGSFLSEKAMARFIPSHDEKEGKDHLLSMLEAKTVDLAVALQAALAECQIKNEQYEALASYCLETPFPVHPREGALNQEAACTTLTEELANEALVPLSEALKEKNRELEVKILTTEHAMNALMEVYQNLLHEYTEESFHSFRLEGALAERILDRPLSSCPSEPVVLLDDSSMLPPKVGNTKKKKSRFTINYDALH